MNTKLQGTGVAIVTPFTKKGDVDYVALEKLVNHIVEGGVEFIVVQGTTGESVTLTTEEKAETLKCVVAANNNRAGIVLGHGGNNTHQLINDFKKLDLTGVDAFLSVSPYYSKPTQEGIVQHFSALAERSPLPIIVYNVPGRTGSNMTPETTLELAHSQAKIIGTKEAAGNLEQVASIVRNAPKDFLVLSGDDALVLGHMAFGGHGVISVIANAYPKLFSDMVRAAAKNDYETARKNHYILHKMIQLIFKEGNPGGIKFVLSELGICENQVRLPLAPISTALENTIKAEMAVIFNHL